MVNFGKLVINNYPLVQAWNGLTRRIQTTVEHMRVTNTEATPMARGHVIGLVAGKRQAEWANSGTGNAEWVGVVTEPIPAGGTGIARISGDAYCLFEAELDPAPVAGEDAYLSTTNGLLTNVYTGIKVGVIGNSHYATDSACDVYLNHCCIALQN